MNLRSVTCAAVAAMVCLPFAAAADDDFGADVSVDMGGMGFGMKVDIRDPNARSQQQAEVEVQASSREEISSSKPGESFKLVYEDHPHGKTVFKVLEPEGLRLRVTEGMWTVKQDSIPTSFDGRAGKFHRFEVFDGKTVVFDKKFEAKRGKLATLWIQASARVEVTVAVAPPPPPVHHEPPVVRVAAPSCMGDSDFGSISGEIENADFSDEKIAVLESAMDDRTICSGQVIRVLGLFDFSNDKLKALEIMAPQIVDTQNNYKIYGAFDFSSDKDKAKRILKK